MIVAEQLAKGTLEPLGARAAAAVVDLDSWLPAGIDRFRQAGELLSNTLCGDVECPDLPAGSARSLQVPYQQLGTSCEPPRSRLRRHSARWRWRCRGFTSRGLAGYNHNFWIVGSTLLPSWGWEWNRGPGEPPLVDQPQVVDAVDFYAALLREAGPPTQKR